MINVAVTGNIAAGKSTVVRWFEEWGAEVIDADTLVRETQRPGTETFEAIVRRFGPGVVADDGALDRAALRREALRSEEARLALNAIVHPAVSRRRNELASDAARRGVPVLINDIPLLFEVLDPRYFDLVVLVDAPAAIRRSRLIEQRGLTPAEADRLIAAQLPSREKRARSHIVIDNGGSLADLHTRAVEAWRTIQQHVKTPGGRLARES